MNLRLSLKSFILRLLLLIFLTGYLGSAVSLFAQVHAQTGDKPPCTYEDFKNLQPGQAFPDKCRPNGLIGFPGGNNKENPSYKSEDVQNALTRIIDIVMPFLGILAVLMIVINGVRMVANASNETKAKEAQKNAIWAAGGLLMIILSYAIITGVIRLVYFLLP